MKIVTVSATEPFVNPHGVLARKLIERPETALVHLTLRPGERIIPHPAPADALFYVLSGTPTAHVGQESVLLSADSVVEGPAGIPHGFTNDSPEEARILVVRIIQ